MLHRRCSRLRAGRVLQSGDIHLQTLVELGVDKNTTVVFPAPLMSTIGELGSFLARDATAAAASPPAANDPDPSLTPPAPNGRPTVFATD
ncbi:hypothetical protein ACFPIJ_04700 [Dactylosporangium cerinum]|uniref:Uncharacterized protein n=1 Tax=Dactylosporangium cerinum TaxID=1434730 RepID=A0ABV9VR99_9ACTN